MSAPTFSAEEIEEFRSDAMEMVDQAESDLLVLDKGGDFRSKFDSIFRVFHSIKGGAGMTGLSEVQEHMHKMENLLSQCKESWPKMKINISFFLAGTDAARQLLGGNHINFEYRLAETASPSPAPERPSPPPAALVSQKAASSETQYTVFAIDDEPDILDNIQDILTEANMRVQTFSEPQLALKALQGEHSPDVVLTDYMMPKMSGLELLKAVRELNPDLPVIYASGHLSKQVLLDSIAIGVHAAIEKPFTEAALIAHCVAAGREYRLRRLIGRSLRLILYQFSDLDDFLASQKKDDVRKTIKMEIETLIKLNRELRKAKPGA